MRGGLRGRNHTAYYSYALNTSIGAGPLNSHFTAMRSEHCPYQNSGQPHAAVIIDSPVIKSLPSFAGEVMRLIVRSQFCLIVVCLALGWLAAQMFRSGKPEPAPRHAINWRTSARNTPMPRLSDGSPARRESLLANSGRVSGMLSDDLSFCRRSFGGDRGQTSEGRQPAAVVLDLDETVFDNSAFQTFLYRNNLEYTDNSGRSMSAIMRAT